MKSFTRLKGLSVPLMRANVDTDAIIPKQFLKSIKRSGFGVNLFDEWRYKDAGYPGQDPDSREPDPEFRPSPKLKLPTLARSVDIVGASWILMNRIF